MSGYRIRSILLPLTALALISVGMAACVPMATPTPRPTSGGATPSEPTPAGAERVVRIVETTPERFEIIDVSKIPARNCKGGSVIRVRESLSKSASEEVTIVGRVSAGIAYIVMLALEAEYHVTDDRQIEKTVEFGVEAPQGKNLEYPVVWKEVWADGYAVVELSDGSQDRVNYSVKGSLRGELLDPEDIGCE